MSSNILLPSHFGAPFVTALPEVRYDSKGRQLGFVESDVQRLERIAFINASKSRSSSPTQSPRSSGASSPSRMKLISEPYGDPIELMANRLAEEFMLSSDEFSSSDEEPFVLYSTSPSSSRKVPAVSSSRPSSSRKAPSPSAFQPGHRRKRSSLSSIPEED
ncbi:hypothetical protein JR316_0010903 [Psilocybe cubensis]|uniref:Uncharacterized protein n=2 Tax=Psilocybe cubensis TaxID=181762 RepID=A0ACB8GNL4_PSICU|nr:hypothetical protein JR316_0010903 [Psilocybe cubensis]KAH9476987.1 hypothetical protein JR316_0010903 [Psilocybe cubensis]